MKTEEVIEMARQAGFPFNKYGLLQGDDEGEIDADEMFKAFAKLVAEKEREACAKLCDDELKEWGIFDSDVGDVSKAIRARGQA